MNTRIIVDSTADLMPGYKEQVRVVPLTVHFGDREYIDGVTIDHKTFYEKLVEEDTLPTTSQATPDAFTKEFEAAKQAGESCVVITLSGKLSGTCQSASIAAADYENVYVVDSGNASVGGGILTEFALQLRDEGLSAPEIAARLNEEKQQIVPGALGDTLDYLKRGGRISKASGAIGGLLGICPLLNMDNEGRLIPRFKIRTKKKVIKKIVDQMEENAEGGLSYSGKCYISQSACYEDARAVADLIEERFPNLNGKVEINNIGTTIGSHTGPGTVALFFWGKERVD